MIALHSSELFQGAVSLLYPATCTICGKNVRADEYLCNCCEAKIVRIVPPFCETCSEPFESCCFARCTFAVTTLLLHFRPHRIALECELMDGCLQRRLPTQLRVVRDL